MKAAGPHDGAAVRHHDVLIALHGNSPLDQAEHQRRLAESLVAQEYEPLAFYHGDRRMQDRRTAGVVGQPVGKQAKHAVHDRVDGAFDGGAAGRLDPEETAERLDLQIDRRKRCVGHDRIRPNI